MTVSNAPRVVEYTANGSTQGPFTVPYQFFNLRVYLDGEVIAPEYYTITQATPGGTGEVYFVFNPAGFYPAGALKIVSATSPVQGTDYTPNDDFPAESHELALDRQMMCVQDILGYLSGALPTDVLGDDSPLNLAVGPQGPAGPTVGAFIVSPIPPINPEVGMEWLDTTTGTVYAYFDDGDSQQWVEFGPGHVGVDGEDGADGADGADGNDGADGLDGTTAALDVVFASSTDTGSDPGSGNIRLNNAALASVTQIAVDDLDANAVAINGIVATWTDAAAGATPKGLLVLRKKADPAVRAVFTVTGVIAQSGYTQITVTHHASSGSFTAADALIMDFIRGAPTPGQLPATTTNDEPTAGNVGEYKEIVISGRSATATISNASPAKVGWTAHGLAVDQPVVFTTTGGLPTGLSLNTTYYVRNPSANDFEVSATPGGASINTSSAGSGTHTAYNMVAMAVSTAWYNIASLQLGVGDWDIRGFVAFSGGATTQVRYIISTISTVSETLDSAPGSRNDFYFDDTTTTTIFSSGNRPSLPIGPRRGLHSGNVTYYLIGMSDFDTSTMRGYGIISARRVR